MGSFNLHCSISHLTIGVGDRYVLVPLKEKGRKLEIGTQFEQMFQAFPPIAGIYDDYGRMVEPDIPAYYEKWEHGAAFIKTATDDLTEVPAGFNYTTIRYEVWELLSGVMCEDSGRFQTAYEAGDLSAEVLGLLGFVEGEPLMKEVDIGHGLSIKEKATRHYRKFTHPKIPTHYIMSDDTWIRLHDAVTGEELPVGLYYPEQLCEMFPQIDASKLEGITYHELRLQKELNKYKEETKRPDYLPDKLDAELLARVRVCEQETRKFAMWSLESHLKLEGVLSGHNLEGKVLTEITKLYAFLSNCSWNGILLMPSLHGPQLGNLYGGLMLAEKIHELAEKDMDEGEQE